LNFATPESKRSFISIYFHEKTFTLSFWQILGARLPMTTIYFIQSFWVNGGMFFGPFFVVFIGLTISVGKSFGKDDQLKFCLYFLSLRLFGTLFFIGNLGSIYDYYFTGYYLIWILVFFLMFISIFRNTF